MDIGAPQGSKTFDSFSGVSSRTENRKGVRSRRERFPVSGASQHEAQNSGRICMHYTALLQNNASFPIMYLCHRVKTWGKPKKTTLKKNMSQGDLATALSVDRAYISNIENGRMNPTLSTLEKIANALGISSSELLK